MKHILITGCSSGIGYYCAKALHEDKNYTVYATCRNRDDVKRLKDEGLWAYRLDLNDSKSIKSALREVLSASSGKLDTLFNNGAYGQSGAVEDLSVRALKEQFETNFFGTHELTREVMKIFRKQKSGRIIYNSSVLGFCAMAYRGAYNASKFALEGLADTLRQELINSEIKVILIEPGPIKSDFRKNALIKFHEHIDVENSPHKIYYHNTLKRLESTKDDAFTLPPNAVLKVLLKAINHKNPKPRYKVTKPTFLLWYAKKFFPTNVLDRLLLKASQ